MKRPGNLSFRALPREAGPSASPGAGLSFPLSVGSSPATRPEPASRVLHTWQTPARPARLSGHLLPSSLSSAAAPRSLHTAVLTAHSLLSPLPRLPVPPARQAVTRHSQRAAPDRSLCAPHILCPLWSGQRAVGLALRGCGLPPTSL